MEDTCGEGLTVSGSHWSGTVTTIVAPARHLLRSWLSASGPVPVPQRITYCFGAAVVTAVLSGVLVWDTKFCTMAGPRPSATANAPKALATTVAFCGAPVTPL